MEKRIDGLVLITLAVMPYPMTTITRIYQLPFIGEFLNAVPVNALMENKIQTIWLYDKSEITKAYTKKVLQPLCIKGSYKGMMTILRHVLKDPYVENEIEVLAKMDKPILIIHGMEDKAIPLDRSKALHHLCKGSTLEIFQKAGHSPHEEYHRRFNQVGDSMFIRINILDGQVLRFMYRIHLLFLS